MGKRPAIKLDIGLVGMLRHFHTVHKAERGARAVFRLCRHHDAAVEKSRACFSDRLGGRQLGSARCEVRIVGVYQKLY